LQQLHERYPEDAAVREQLAKALLNTAAILFQADAQFISTSVTFINQTLRLRDGTVCQLLKPALRAFAQCLRDKPPAGLAEQLMQTSDELPC
jgi:hypothetical protein